MTAEKTPVFLLTGFLGSGKTTLLNKALKEPTLANTAVVVNELGEIGLDNVMIAQATDNVVLLDAGCLCCANTGALHETLADLDGRRARGEIPPFERVIIETSGAGSATPLVSMMTRRKGGISPRARRPPRSASVSCSAPVLAQHRQPASSSTTSSVA